MTGWRMDQMPEWKTEQDGFARGEEVKVDAIEKQIYKEKQKQKTNKKLFRKIIEIV